MKARERNALLALQNRIAWCIDAAADRAGNDTRDLLSTLVKTIETQEKQHRKLGHSWVGARGMRGTASLRAAVNHFLCMVIHEGLTKYRCGAAPISALCGVRTDYVLGALLCGDKRFTDALVSFVRERFPDEPPTDAIERAASVDYCEAIAAPEVRS